jgi:hypothetical protein
MGLGDKVKRPAAETLDECKARVSADLDAAIADDNPACEVEVPYAYGLELREWVESEGLRCGLNLGHTEAGATLVIAWTLAPPPPVAEKVIDGPA